MARLLFILCLGTSAWAQQSPEESIAAMHEIVVTVHMPMKDLTLEALEARDQFAESLVKARKLADSSIKRVLRLDGGSFHIEFVTARDAIRALETFAHDCQSALANTPYRVTVTGNSENWPKVGGLPN